MPMQPRPMAETRRGPICRICMVLSRSGAQAWQAICQSLKSVQGSSAGALRPPDPARKAEAASEVMRRNVQVLALIGSGARRLLLLGLAIMGAAMTALGFVPSYGLMLVLVAAAGIGNSVFHPADYAI